MRDSEDPSGQTRAPLTSNIFLPPQLSFQLVALARYTVRFLIFFAATIYSWVLSQKPRVDAAMVRGAGAAATLALESVDALARLHARIEAGFGAAVACLGVGSWVGAELVVLGTTAAVAVAALRSVFDVLCDEGGPGVHWRGVCLLAVTAGFAYGGYLWVEAV